MRSICGILVLLLGVGLMSCRIEGRSADATAPESEVEWVRTVDGWEQPHHWASSLAEPPALHPLVVAVGQTLVSLFALVAVPDPKRSGK